MLSPTPAIDRSTLHPGTGYLIAPRVPHGLAAVVEGLTREILRHRPEDIYVFAAHHFEKLLKLREQYHAEEYNSHEFNYEFNREFNLWPTKNTEIKKFSNNAWSLEKEIEILEGHRKGLADAEESMEDVSTDKENRKELKQTCSENPTITKRVSKRSKDKETPSDARATKIISQMPGLHGPSKNIQAKDIKQELRKNKLSGEKGKTINRGTEKAIRGERRSRTRSTKSEKGPEEENERSAVMTTVTTTTTATTISTTSRTSTRRPLKKVRRIETESETETERETASKNRFENGYQKSSLRDEDTTRTTTRTKSKERRPEAQLSEHSSGRKVSSRALSMDRIRAYVLRKFASTASLEVLRSPTYVEQVQEVIDHAAPIIKEKLEEIRRPRGRRSRSVDLGWDDELFHRRMRDDKKRDNGDKEEENKERTGSEREADSTEQEETENSLGKNGTILKKKEKKQRKRSVGSDKRSKRHKNDEIEDKSKHNGKSEHESKPRDTLEARLTATQNILEGISKSTSELGGTHKIESGEALELEASDVNAVSLPIVRPPSARNSKNVSKNGADNLTLPPISPEAPKSMKKKNELSLPVLPVNGSHSMVKSQESQDVSKDVEDASTMRDITSDIEDIAILPQDDHVLDMEQDLETTDVIPDIRTFVNEEMEGKTKSANEEQALEEHTEKSDSLEEFKELEELERGKERREEIFKDSLNVTPEIIDIPPRPDSLEPDNEIKLEDDGIDPAQDNRFDELKDKLIEIETAEKNIEKALAGQQVATCENDKAASQAEISMTDVEINEAGMLADEVKETVSEIKKSVDKAEVSMNEEEKKEDKEETKPTDKAEETENLVEVYKMENLLNETEKSINITEKTEDKTESLRKETENLNTEMEKKVKKSENKISETERTKNEIDILETKLDMTVNQPESIKITEKEQVAEKKKLSDRNEKSLNVKLANNKIEELAIKVHVEDTQSANAGSYDTDDQMKAVVSEMKNDSYATESKSKHEMAIESPHTIVSGNVSTKNKTSRTLDENSNGEMQKKDKNDKSSTTSPKIPYTYVLSEGSPCKIPDSVTTVIIPDRPCLSPIAMEAESHQLGSRNQKEESIIHSDVVKENKTQEKDRNEYEREAFGEYVRPEITSLPADIDFVRGVKGAKLGQEIVIVHQDLDKIKEEGEEENEEKEEHTEIKEMENFQEKNDHKEEIVQNEETIKLTGTLENIAEHEEIEETDAGTNAELKKNITSDAPAYESLPDTTELMDTSMTDNGKADIVVEPKSTLENSSEESGSTQDNGTITSSDVKENTVSNRSVENSSLDRPVVPELNLDSLQDNTVSSFKMTANDTTKEDNGSPRESDATTSLIEPLTSDERLMNRPALVDHEEEIPVEQFTAPEADQLYQAEHAEYVWMEKDPLSSETMEDEAKSREDSIGLMALPEDIVQVGPLLQEKEEDEKLNSEEEIARELIRSLNEEMELRAKQLDSKEESKDNGESVKNNLAVDDKVLSSQVLSSTSVEEAKQRENEISSKECKKLDDESIKTELMDKLNHITDTTQNDKNKEDTVEKSIVVEEEKETTQVAPLAQFEQDDLESNSRPGTAKEKITIKHESKSIIDTDSSDTQEKYQNNKPHVEKILENQSKERMDKAEDLNQKKQESKEEIPEKHKQDKLKMQEANDQAENLNQKKGESKEEIPEKHEQDKLKMQEANDQAENLNQKKEESKEEIPEKHEQDKLKMRETNDQTNLKLQKEILNTTAVPLEMTESKKDSINEYIENDKKHDEDDLTNHDKSNEKSVISEKEMKDGETTAEEKTKDLSTEAESVHESVTSAISEQSMEDHPHGGYWTTGTKSSTVETVIETASPNSSTTQIMKAVADASEIVGEESLNTKKDDFYLAVVKIQAYIRGFLARRRIQKDLCSKSVPDNVPSAQKIATDHLAIPQDTVNLRETRGRRLRREEALRNTTLSVENAFATGRLQHTSEFHDSVPLPLFDNITNDELSLLNKSSSKEKNVEQVKQSDVAKSSTNESDSVMSHDDDDNEHARNFQKSTSFTNHSAFPIVIHLMADSSRNGHFRINQSYNPDFKPTVGGSKPIEQMGFLMDCPRDDDNRYLNFITSIEDLGSNMDSLPLDDAIEISKSIEDAHHSMTSGEGSIRESLALPDTPRGVVIEEVTSLDETVPSESMKLSTTPEAPLDTNSSVVSEEHTLEDEKGDLGLSPRTTDVTGNREHTDEEADRQKLRETLVEDGKLENVAEVDSHAKDTSEKSNASVMFHDNQKHEDEERNEKA